MGLSLIAGLSSCEKTFQEIDSLIIEETGNNTTECVDPSLIDSTKAIITLYDPVCGCNGETYSNSAAAEVYGGVTSYTKGPCATGNN